MLVNEGELIRSENVFRPMTEREEGILGASFLRSAGMCMQDNFDRMTTEYRFWVRCAPASSMQRSGFDFKKYVEIFEIPNECSEETKAAVGRFASMVASVLREASDARD